MGAGVWHGWEDAGRSRDGVYSPRRTPHPRRRVLQVVPRCYLLAHIPAYPTPRSPKPRQTRFDFILVPTDLSGFGATGAAVAAAVSYATGTVSYSLPWSHVTCPSTFRAAPLPPQSLHEPGLHAQPNARNECTLCSLLLLLL